MMANFITSFTVSSYNCRGFNSVKSRHIASLLARCNILVLQEHWLADGQLNILASISENMSYTAVSGFDCDDVLVGRPFGGCAILWQANLLASVCPLRLTVAESVQSGYVLTPGIYCLLTSICRMKMALKTWMNLLTRYH